MHPALPALHPDRISIVHLHRCPLTTVSCGDAHADVKRSGNEGGDATVRKLPLHFQPISIAILQGSIRLIQKNAK